MLIVACIMILALFLVVAFLTPASAPNATMRPRSSDPEEGSAAVIPELSFEEHCELLIEDD